MKNLFIEYSDAVLITQSSDLYYLSGYVNADAKILYYKGEAFYFTDSRYFEEVNSLLHGFTIKDIVSLNDFIKSERINTIGIEKNLSYEEIISYQQIGVRDFFFVDDVINEARAVKTAEELSIMRKAQQITDRAFIKILDRIQEGMTERALASQLETLLFQEGGDDLAFTSIVAFGANTSKPHAHRSENKLSNNSFVTMDFGAKYKGYCSDMTRTVYFGTPSKEEKELYNTVLTAQKLALDRIKPGMTGRECDAISRDYFLSKSLDQYFIHSLGHSLGIDIHEKPNFSPRCDTVMQANYVLSVEPGLYIPSKYGVRIEDVIIFEANSIIDLTNSEKNMIIL